MNVDTMNENDEKNIVLNDYGPNTVGLDDKEKRESILEYCCKIKGEEEFV